MEIRRFFDQRGALTGHRAEQVGMQEGQAQRAITAHGNSADSPFGTIACGSVAMLDEGDELPQKEIFVARMAIMGIDIEAGFARRRYDQEFAYLVTLPEIFDQVPASGTDEGLLVVAEAMKKIQDRKDTSFIGVVARRQKRAVGNLLAEDFTFHRETFGAAGVSSGRRPRCDRE